MPDPIVSGARAVPGLVPGAALPALGPATSHTPSARVVDTGFDQVAFSGPDDPGAVDPAAPTTLQLDPDVVAGIIERSSGVTTPLPGGDTTTPPPGDPPGGYRRLPGGLGPPAESTTQPAPAEPTTPTPRAQVVVYDSSAPDANGVARYIGTATELATGIGPQNARVAAAHVQRGLDYFADTFGRNGVDGAGAGVNVVINDRSKDANGEEAFKGNGGYYLTPMPDGSTNAAIRFGTGTAYNHRRGGTVSQYEMLYADDLSIHELGHGVINAATGQIGGEADEQGAVNEALADILAASATRDWVIGERMFSPDSDYRSLRNIGRPDDPTAVHGLWTHMSQYTDAVARGSMEEHYASGILSHAAHRMQARIGGEAGWNAVEQVTYQAIVGGELGDVTFESTAAALRSTANQLWGAGSSNARVVDEELRRAGL